MKYDVPVAKVRQNEGNVSGPRSESRERRASHLITKRETHREEKGAATTARSASFRAVRTVLRCGFVIWRVSW